MTTQELIDYYANLLILQYLQQPKAYAHVQALVTPVIMDQLPLDVQDAFDITTSEGVQLDVLGKYAGITRNVYDFTGPVSLSDADFRSLILIKISQNSLGSSLATIQEFINNFFPGVITVFDFKDMTMEYFLESSIGSQQLAEVLIKQNLLPRPMGVRLKPTIYSPTIDAFFGFRTYDLAAFNVSPFNTYDVYTADTPWLSYDDALLP